MRGADSYNESLFSTVRLEEFVPQAHPHPLRRVMVRGLEKVNPLLTLTMAAYNLTRLRSLAALRPQSA
ncbi:putative transposase [Burkholderia aenigmatica]|uniref:Transposase n=1 Tax=Burkholderia aenigmatica TaxID=2015348 RepID=A0ABY6Y6X4_9BURK|nr:putative transposase [Burkholderia aenigmatica]VWD46874.1 putative transposase [Burkholderia aenigmatica]